MLGIRLIDEFILRLHPWNSRIRRHRWWSPVRLPLVGLSTLIDLSTTVPLFVSVLLHFTLPLLRLGLLLAATAHADPIIVLGFDLLLVGQVREIQAALLVNRPALFVETGTAALPQPVQQVHIAAWAILVPHGHAVDQGVGEPLDPPQGAGLTQGGLLLALLAR